MAERTSLRAPVVRVSLHQRDEARLSEIVSYTRLPAQEVIRRLIRRHYRDEFQNGPARRMYAEDIGVRA